MPELPEVTSLVAMLNERAVGHFVTRVDVSAFNVLKTYDPPVAALAGCEVTGAARYGKFIDLEVGGLHLVMHLARAGWLAWRKELPAAPPKPGKGPLALRLHLDDGAGFDLTEAGTQKRLAAYLVRSVAEVPGVARLGLDVLSPSFTVEALTDLLSGKRMQVKGLLRDQSLLAGVGNAYSDEALWEARLSPYKLASSLTEAEVATLHAALIGTLTAAVGRAAAVDVAALKAEKKAGMAVHARAGLPCPRCGDTVLSVSFADSSWQYCPTCQTGGKPLADRRMSKLLR